MKDKKIQENKEVSVLDILDKQYLEAENREELDYWAPLSKIILESIELRDSKRMSQTDLANKMKTTQSVISRFENMGRLPSYDFVARLSISLGHAPGMTLFGDYMAVAPLEKQPLIKTIADEKNISTGKFIQNLLDQAIAARTHIYKIQQRIMDNASGLSPDFEVQEDNMQACPAPLSAVDASIAEPNNIHQFYRGNYEDTRQLSSTDS